MKKHILLTAIMSTMLVCLLVCAPQSKAFGYTDDLTDYGWNVLKDGANFYWSFNEAGASDWALESSRGQTNDQLEAQYGATRVIGLTDNLGQAASFNGAESVFYADSLNDGRFNGAWAMELWFQMDAPATNQSIYLLNAMGAGGGGQPSVIYGYNADTIEVHTPGGRTGTAVPTLTDTDWHHLVVTYYGNADLSYGVANRVDMTIDGSTTTISPHDLWPDMAVDGALNVGRWTNYAGTAFDGQIDEVAIYNLGGMTEVEIEAKTAVISGHMGLINDSPDVGHALIDPDTVTYTVTPGGAPVHPDVYTDTTGDELADGLFANGADNLTDPNSMAFYDPNAANTSESEVIFDLGESKALDSVWIDYLDSAGKWGVVSPQSFALAFSTDGVNYSGDVLIDEIVGEGADYSYFQAKRAIAEAGGVEAQYVKLTITKVGTFAFMSEVSFIEELAAPGDYIPGDADKNGVVDDADAAILAANWLSNSGSWGSGDFNFDGVVNDEDVTLMAANWTSGSPPSSVPEPSTIVLLASLMIALGLIRRKR